MLSWSVLMMTVTRRRRLLGVRGLAGAGPAGVRLVLIRVTAMTWPSGSVMTARHCGGGVGGREVGEVAGLGGGDGAEPGQVAGFGAASGEGEPVEPQVQESASGGLQVLERGRPGRQERCGVWPGHRAGSGFSPAGSWSPARCRLPVSAGHPGVRSAVRSGGSGSAGPGRAGPRVGSVSGSGGRVGVGVGSGTSAGGVVA